MLHTISARLLAIPSVTNRDYCAAFGSTLILPPAAPALVFLFIFFLSCPITFFFFFFIINYTFVFYFHLSYIQDLPRLPVTRPCRGPPCPARKFHTVTSFVFARLLTLHFLLLFIVLPRPRWTFCVAWYFNTNTPSFSFLFFFLLSLRMRRNNLLICDTNWIGLYYRIIFDGSGLCCCTVTFHAARWRFRRLEIV